MEIIADLHIHSRFSRACSKNIDFENLVKWAKVKGLGILGTGDFTHPVWIKEIEEKLKEDNGNGVYYLGDFPFIITGEVSLMYSQNGKGRRVHLLLLVPNLDIAKKINEWLDTKGRRDYDGRPIFNISCRDFTAKMQEIDDKIEVIPAHCLLPDSLIHISKGVKKIKEIILGELVLTHKGEFKTVSEVLVNDYTGKVYHIIPWYFREGLITTPEHPFYIIKSYKNCKSTKGLCKPLCSAKKSCKKRFYDNYKPEWTSAEKIEKGDFLVYPRVKQEKDIFKIDLCDYVKDYKKINGNLIISKNARNHTGKINRFIDVDEKFCRLLGYFLSEGYLITNEAIGFSFHAKEQQYINEVISFIKESFGFGLTNLDSRRENQADLVFNSKILNSFFSNFYLGDVKRANTKILPAEFVVLTKNKLAEIFRGWWRGDTGITVSRQLANQMKMICLKLGIIPSISIDNIEDYKKRGKHFIKDREIIAKSDLIIFSNLSFFEEDYGMLKENCFRKSINKINRKHGWVDENYIYLPVRKIDIKNYRGEVYNLEVNEDNSYVSEFACVHNCWTPWFGIFGSKTGFDSLQEAFLDKTDRIHAIETGLSSDPEMNWKIKELNNISIISFSDSHSFWPWRLGREATIFILKENEKLSYNSMIEQIRNKTFKTTIEVDPSYGMYHFDGHRNCNFSCSPQKTKELNGICPVCNKPLTLGVDYRVNKLANQQVEMVLEHVKPFYKILPLHELISLAKGTGISSKSCWNTYNQLIESFGNELNILLNVKKDELAKVIKDELLIELIIKNRIGNIKVKPGYDGEYGIPILPEKQVKLL
ncbi:MAG: hypothetical protein Q8N63_01735 [Nanoarchaeota archaeon]|nr:hypothetical protein [Nanoarchaeota archaeon]